MNRADWLLLVPITGIIVYLAIELLPFIVEIFDILSR